jgi:hypothetical protein
MHWGAMGLNAKQTASMAMVLDQSDIGQLGLHRLKLKQEKAYPPLRSSFAWRPPGKGGITAQRVFQRRNPLRTLLLSICPYSSDELAIAMVMHAEELMIHNPTRHIVIHEIRLDDFKVQGLANIYAYEETMEGPKGTYKFLIVFSHVESVQFVVELGSLDGCWKWDDAARIATIQAEKIRMMGVIPGVFD